MTISYQWLKSFLPELDLQPIELAALLTDIGLEVEAIEEFESIKGGLKGLVIGEVVEKEKHPDADRLSVTKVKVDDSGILHQIVCGAPNVAKGQKVIVALPGTTLFPIEGDSFKIKNSKIRGVDSMGMICAEDEIGLGNSHDGIMVLPGDVNIGTKADKYFNIETDAVIHIGLTPNRIDAASHLGVARELKAALLQRYKKNIKLKEPEVSHIVEGNTNKISIQNITEGCDKYLGVVIENIKVQPSPSWLRNRLMAIGLRPINNIVDITNYVMHECGQPLHAFDLNKIEGNKVIIRNAAHNEKLVTLDGVIRTLNETDMIIANANEPMCIAGVFGGLNSGVTESTKSILLESAYFNPVSVRKTAKRYELHTDSSFRFERGVDPEMTDWALKRAVLLIQEIANGKTDLNFICQCKTIFKNHIIELDLKSLNKFTGYNLNSDDVKSILENLDFKVLNATKENLQLQSPLYRVDVTRPIDVYEEILRIYGYNNIPIPEKLNATPEILNDFNKESLIESISDFLSAKGYNEIMNNSLNSINENSFLNNNIQNSIHLLNPLSSELSVLRNSLIYGGLKSIAYNNNRQQNDLKFFEIGNVYCKNGDSFIEEQYIGIWLTGNTVALNWKSKVEKNDFYAIKGLVESLLNRYTKTNCEIHSNENPLLFDVMQWKIDSEEFVEIGSVQPEILSHFDINQPVYYASIKLSGIIKAIKRTKFKYKEVSKFPSIRRDLSLLLNDNVSFDDLKQIVTKTNKNLIKDVSVFDVYTGKNLESGKKSYAISILICDESKTLTDIEIDALMNKILKNITDSTGAILRS